MPKELRNRPTAAVTCATAEDVESERPLELWPITTRTPSVALLAGRRAAAAHGAEVHKHRRGTWRAPADTAAPSLSLLLDDDLDLDLDLDLAHTPAACRLLDRDGLCRAHPPTSNTTRANKTAAPKAPVTMDYVDKRLQEEAVKQHDGQRNDAFFTPLNILVLLILGYTIYVLLRPTPPPALPKEPPATVFRVFTPRTLLPYTGEDGTPVYVAVRGRVFDVTAGRNFYGPGGPYSNFAGRDATRGLACGSFDEDMLTQDLDGPLDTLDGLGRDEMEALQGWEETFDSKYLVVGRLVPAGEEDK